MLGEACRAAYVCLVNSHGSVMLGSWQCKCAHLCTPPFPALPRYGLKFHQKPSQFSQKPHGPAHENLELHRGVAPLPAFVTCSTRFNDRRSDPARKASLAYPSVQILTFNLRIQRPDRHENSGHFLSGDLQRNSRCQLRHGVFAHVSCPASSLVPRR